MTALTPEKLAGLRIEAAEAMRCRWYAQVLGADLLALLDALEACSSKATSGALSEAERKVLDAAMAWNDRDTRREIETAELELAAACDELRAASKGKPE